MDDSEDTTEDVGSTTSKIDDQVVSKEQDGITILVDGQMTEVL